MAKCCVSAGPLDPMASIDQALQPAAVHLAASLFTFVTALLIPFHSVMIFAPDWTVVSEPASLIQRRATRPASLLRQCAEKLLGRVLA